MNKKASDIAIIGYGLTVLYAVLFAVYFQSQLTAMQKQGFQLHYVILAVLFCILCIGSIAVANLKEWGRMVLVWGNALLGIYVIKLFLDSIKLSDLIHIAYVLFSFTMLLYFSQTKIKLRFQIVKSRSDWKSILIIDDDETIIKIVRPLLISRGFSVLTTSTGETGLQIAKNQKPDLIILDVILPGMKGREVCKKLKENRDTSQIPVVFLTAKFSEDDIQAERAVGAVSHLTKPVNANELVKTVKNILESEY